MSEVTGKIRIIGETQEIGANGFTKRQVIVDTDEQFSQSLPIDFIKDKCAILNNINPGDLVRIAYNLRGNEYNGKFYCSIQGWRIAREMATQETTPQAPVTKNESFQPASNFKEEDHDDLPF